MDVEVEKEEAARTEIGDPSKAQKVTYFVLLSSSGVDRESSRNRTRLLLGSCVCFSGPMRFRDARW